MEALVLGCGSIGLRHINHLLRLGISDVSASDPDPRACQMAHKQFGISAITDTDEALQRGPDVVLVCTPAQFHVPVALKALDIGAHVFIEKPLSTSLGGLDALVRKAQTKNRTVQVGYNLRYHPAMKAMKRMVEAGHLGRVLIAHAEFGLYLNKWWPNRDYRKSYMAHSDLGGGLLMDASHEIDSLLWFLGGVEEVSAMGGKLSLLEIDGADAIKVVMKMKSGAVASLHLDCLQPTYTRQYMLAGEGTCLRWDCHQGRSDTSLGRLLLFDQNEERFTRVRLRGEPQNTYLDELRDFLACVKTGNPPLVGLQQGIEVLRVVLAVQRAMETGETVKV